MTPQEQRMIESLFERLAHGAAQAGPRDPQADALILERVQALPGAAYYMAQALLVHERALQQAEARLGPPPPRSVLPRSGDAAEASPPPQQPAAGGFLAGAGRVALGVVGGVLVADAAAGLAQDPFTRRHSTWLGQGYDEGYRQGPGHADPPDLGGTDPQGEPGGYAVPPRYEPADE